MVSAGENADDALQELCLAYWAPLYRHVRRMGYDRADAHDLTQAFFARVLEKGLIASANAARGRFRTFLLTSLNRFVINEWRRERSAKRGGGHKTLPLDFASVDDGWSYEPTYDTTPEDRFEHEWALTIIERAFDRLRELHAKPKKREFFEAIVPCFSHSTTTPRYELIAKQLGSTVPAVKMATTRLRKQLRELIIEEVQATVSSADGFEDELDHLFRALRT